MPNDYLTLLQGGASGSANPYLDDLQRESQVRDSAFKASTMGAVGQNPDAYATARRVASYLGTTPPAVMALPVEAERAAKMKAIDADTADTPTLRSSYTDVDFARLAHDDSGVLSSIERAVSAAARYIVSAPGQRNTLMGDVAAGVFGASRGAAGVFRAAAELAAPVLDPLTGTLLPENPLRRVAAGFAGLGAQAGAAQKALSPPAEGIVAGGVSSGIQSLTQNMLTLPLAFLPGGQAAALGSMVAGQGGQSYLDAREQGIPMATALPFAVSQAAIEYATEKLPLQRLVGDLKTNTPVFKALLHNVATEVPGEQLATVLQDMNEWAILHPEKPFKDYLAERPSAAAQTLIATLVGVGGQVTLMHAVKSVADTATGQEQRAQQADRSQQALAELATLAEASKLRERDPAAFATFAQQLADQHVPALYVEAKALAEAGVDMPALAQAMPSVAAQFEQALQSGGDVVIPTGEFMAAGPGQTFLQPLLEHARTAADAMSPAEAKVYMQQHGDALQAEIGRVLAGKQGELDAIAGHQELADGFAQQLQAAGRTPEVARTEGAAIGAFFAVQAARVGITPAEMAQRYPLQITGKLGQGETVLEQPGGLEALRQQWGDAGVSSMVSERDGIITLSQIVVPEAERGTGKGTAAMRALVDYADRTGQSIALSPSADLGATSRGRLVKFYKQFGFIENKGKNRAFTVSESMYRPAPGAVLEQQARGQIALGADITATPSIITLLQGADLSTFTHEAGHFYLEVLTDLAAKIEAQQRAGAGVSDGEAEILADAQKLLAWFGIQDTPEQSALTQWFRLSADEKRPHHEAFARGFEAYAFEGKAPSVELQGPFQKFRAWMLSVYQQLKALNVELTDEVRGVMDRMLATTEQIQTAEAARGMGALFETPEQAGMTPEQWAQYHALAVDATQTAIDTLQARGLRDMQWLQNARGRKLKELQRRADGLRREVRSEARGEILAEPVYRAWQFLTGKGEAIDTAPGEPAKEGTGKLLDPTRDSLLVAIAKLGGINRTSATKDAGVHADYHRTESGVFGMPVFRKTGGFSADRMAEQLAEAGYLPLDENGQHSLHELEQAISDELGGQPRYSTWHDYAQSMGDQPTGPLPDHVLFGKLSTGELRRRYGDKTDAVWRKLSALRMTSEANGLNPDVVAETFGFDSGDALVQALVAAEPMQQAIEGLTDQRMLERFGDLATPEGLERATDEALHSDARARFIATELGALEAATSVREKVPGTRRTVDVMARAARNYADGVIARLKVRDLRPGQYTAGEARAARAAAKALKAGDTAAAAAAKRDQLIQNEAARAAVRAQDEIEKAVAYFRRFDKRIKALDIGYQDQIEQLLARYSLRSADSLRAIDKRKSLAQWAESQREQGMEPDIPEGLLDEAQRTHFKDLTVEQVRGLRDTIKQIEHLGRLKGRLLTAQAQREFDAARDEIVDSIEANARGRVADTRTPATTLGRALAGLRRFGAAHVKVATWARVFDGGKDGGPVWEYFIRSANERGDQEITMRAAATEQLHTILAPLMAAAKLGGKGQFFPSIGRSMNREQVLAMALNTGNTGNVQRMLGGEGWTAQQIKPVLDTLTAADWHAVQAIWDHFETYRPAIGAKERRVYGKEPAWVEPQPLQVHTADDQVVTLRGGYYPIKYDPLANNRAEQHDDAELAKRQLQGAYTSATTRRGFTKSRAEEVSGRPLLYSLAGVYSGVNDVIHDLAWHEWLIDANKLLRSDKIDAAIRGHYGPEVVRQFKSWVADIAEGDKGMQAELDTALARIRHGVSIAGLGFNVMSAFMQPLGLTQSIVRVGAANIARGVTQYIANPVAATRRVNEASEYMASRSRTRFRELAELRAQVEGQHPAREAVGRYAYVLMMRCQQMVDTPTWLGAYERAVGEGNGEERAVALADQAVIDAQGGGTTKDLSAIERGGPAQKLFTVFYSFMNTALNIGVAQTMTSAPTARGRAKLAGDMLMLYTVPAVLGALLKDALTPGDAGDDEKALIRKLLAAQLDYLLGLFAVVREFGAAGKAVTGLEDHTRDYGGPAGVRLVSDAVQAGKQIGQGEFDDQLRKSLINVTGSMFGLPSAQINRTITGAQALSEGKTSNPAALAFGYQEPR